MTTVNAKTRRKKARPQTSGPGTIPPTQAVPSRQADSSPTQARSVSAEAGGTPPPASSSSAQACSFPTQTRSTPANAVSSPTQTRSTPANAVSSPTQVSAPQAQATTPSAPPSRPPTQVSPGGASPNTNSCVCRARVLIVEDEPMLLDMLRLVVGQVHDVTGAASAEQALNLFQSGLRFDAVLCDLWLPKMSGADLHREVARLAPGQEAAFIFISGGGYSNAAKDFLQSVPNPRLNKPFDIEDLLALIHARLTAASPALANPR